MKRKIIYFLLALAVVMPASAQKFFKDAISLSDVSLWQQGNSLYVDMKIDMKNLTVSPERMLTLTPLLTDGQHNVALEEDHHQRQTPSEGLFARISHQPRTTCRNRNSL